MKAFENQLKTTKPLDEARLNELSFKVSETGKKLQVGDKLIYVYLKEENGTRFTAITSDEIDQFYFEHDYIQVGDTMTRDDSKKLPTIRWK